jgi:hypothetical protein
MGAILVFPKGREKARVRKFAYNLASNSLKNTFTDRRGVTGSTALRSKCFDLSICHIYFFPNFTFKIFKVEYAFQPALQPWVSLGLLYNQSLHGVRFLNKTIFYRMGLLAPCPTPILKDQDFSLSLDCAL